MATISYKLFIDRFNVIRNPFNHARKGKYAISSSLFHVDAFNDLYSMDIFKKGNGKDGYTVFSLIATENSNNDVVFAIHPGTKYKNSTFNQIIGYFISKNCPRNLSFSSATISDLNFELISVQYAANMLNNLKKQSYDKFFKVKFIKRTDGNIRNMTARFGVKKNLSGKKQSFNPESKNLVTVYDANIKDYRSIPTDSIISLSLEGKTFFVKH
jgi:hypothetical protein